MQKLCISTVSVLLDRSPSSVGVANDAPACPAPYDNEERAVQLRFADDKLARNLLLPLV